MKKLIALIIALLIVLTLCACGGRPSGAYTCYMASLKFMTLNIDGDQIDRITYDLDGSVEKSAGGTFEMEGDVVVVQWNDGKHDRFTYDSGEEKLSLTDSFFFVKD